MKEILEMARKIVAKLEEREKEDKVQLSTLAAGDKFTTEIGTFIVLEQTGLSTKVITEKLYKENIKFSSTSTNYETSDLKKLCDGEIYEDFAKVFGKENIITANVKNCQTVDGQKLPDINDLHVTVLTFDEARKYNALLVNKDLPDWYWTMTPWSSKDRGWEYSVTVVSPSGDINGNSYDIDRGVRPVCILKSNIFVSKEN